MNPILRSLQTPYVDAQTLLTLLSDYRKPREWILRMVNQGELIRLKNGFYLIKDKITDSIPYEQVANLLYGPSYVSLEWALSFYGMIPERVYVITSMALLRSKHYHTSVGDFVYYRLSSERYPIGVTQKMAADFIGGFMIASPEKALADLVFVRCPRMNKGELMDDLVQSKRIDPESLQKLNKPLLLEIAGAYRSRMVDYLVDIVGRI